MALDNITRHITNHVRRQIMWYKLLWLLMTWRQHDLSDERSHLMGELIRLCHVLCRHLLYKLLLVRRERTINNNPLWLVLCP